MSENTCAAYARDLEEFAGFLGRAEVDDLERVDHKLLRLFLANQQAMGYERSTVARRCACIKGFCGFLVESGALSSDPSTTLSFKTKGRKLPRFLTEAEAEALLDEPVRGAELALRDRAIIETLYATGIRVGELCATELRGLDLDALTLRVTGKGDRERVALLGEPAARAIALYVRYERPGLVRRSGYTGDVVFLGKRGSPIDQRQVRRIVEREASSTGSGDHVSPHTLRHSFATHMLAHGADLRTVQELLGHKNVATTQIYTHLTKNEIRKAYDKSHPHS